MSTIASFTTIRALRRSGAVAALTLVLLVGGARSALAVSMSDLVQLAHAGLSDDVLVALIEADDTTFNLDAPTILDLRAKGISERVLTAMLKNGRGAPPPQARTGPAEPEPPSLVIIGESPAPPPPAQPLVYIPWAPMYTGTQPPLRARTVPGQGYRGFGRFINDGWVDRTAPTPR